MLKDCFVKLFNLILKVRKVPVTWCKGLITPVHKKGDPSNPDNFRPICVLSCLCKFLTNVLNHRLASISKKEKLIHVTQIGFQEGCRTTDYIFSVKTLVDKHAIGKPRRKLYACFLDFKKAYDSVWHDERLDNESSGASYCFFTTFYTCYLHQVPNPIIILLFIPQTP